MVVVKRPRSPRPTAARRSCVTTGGSRPPAPRAPGRTTRAPSASPLRGPRPALPRRPRGRAIRRRGALRGRGDPPVARRLALGARGGVEEGREVAASGRPRSSGRRRGAGRARCPTRRWRPRGPPRSSARAPGHVGVDVAHERSRAEPLLPDPALQRLEGGGLAVLLHEPEQVGGGSRERSPSSQAGGGSAGPRARALREAARRSSPTAGSLAWSRRKAAKRARANGNSMPVTNSIGVVVPFDVEERRAAAAASLTVTAAAVPRSGAGPRQTGSKPRSTPLSV